jgi:hypothetical protein
MAPEKSIPSGLICMGLSLPVLAMDSSLVHPVVLLPLGSIGPLAERFWIVNVDTGIGKGAGETAHKEAKRGWVIQVHPGLMTEEFK